jgi:hypothetical protein
VRDVDADGPHAVRRVRFVRALAAERAHDVVAVNKYEPDELEPKWIALIYVLMLVPGVSMVSYLYRRVLVHEWRDRFPNRVAQLRVHGAIANLATFFFMVLLACAFVLWLVWRILY